MALHIEQFAQANLEEKSQGYLISLWIVFSRRLEKGKLSDKIKDELSKLGRDILKINIPRRKEKYAKLLNSRQVSTLADPIELKSLGAMRVKNFRGFGALPGDDKGTYVKFSSGKNIFYAPNGGGKTSLCEAIEYIVTGSLKEADRRHTKVNEYIRRGQEKVNLVLKASDGSNFTSSPKWSTCFIDRNRLQEFSLLGSKDTSFVERDVLAALFGLEEIEELIQRFVLPKSFNLDHLKSYSTKEKIENLKNHHREHLHIKKQHLQEIYDNRKEICLELGLDRYDRFEMGKRFEYKKRLLEYKEDKLRNLKTLSLPQYITKHRYEAVLRTLRRAILSYDTSVAELADNLSEIDFQKLFEVIDKIGESQDENLRCPACLTPVDDTVENPFIRAKKELNRFETLKALQEGLKVNEGKLTRCTKIIKNLINATQENNTKGIVLSDFATNIENLAVLNMPTLLPSEHRSLVALGIEWLTTNKNEVLAYLEKCHEMVLQGKDNNTLHLEKQSQINALQASILNIQIKKSAIQDSLRRIRGLAGTLKEFYGTLKLYNHDLKNENRYNHLLTDIQSQYQTLYNDLLKYKLEVEESQITGIENKATNYYQKINEHDDDCEKIYAIKFDRQTTGYRIKIRLADDLVHDAFSSLSEGHLRSLGLALLLAVAEKYKYPFIVFDDVVNAIDSDHRANIIKLMFNDPYLKSTQQIITTHDRLFWERYCNTGAPEKSNETFTSRTLKYTNKGLMVIDYSSGFSSKVQAALTVSDVRQALVYCRIWLETIVVKYCITNKCSITGVFTERHLKPNNLLEISLESMYDLIEAAVAKDTTHLNTIKKDLINWKGQNQEHHAFDETGLNFVHSKTSSEVKDIFTAITKLEYQLFPDDLCAALLSEKELLEKKLTMANRKLDDVQFMAHAKAETIDNFVDSKKTCETLLSSIEADMTYIEQWQQLSAT
ncbi:hypothetical protein ACN079_22490 [Pseudomonas sp. ABY48]|uniref:hypothetical protein n=1 Tax=Pseudomonas sp. ABY48 TaxID=3402865 RepID=UPI003B43D308